MKGVRLPTGYFLGVTAATGDLSDNHDIISMRFYELDMPGDVSSLDLLRASSIAHFYVHKILLSLLVAKLQLK